MKWKTEKHYRIAIQQKHLFDKIYKIDKTSARLFIKYEKNKLSLSEKSEMTSLQILCVNNLIREWYEELMSIHLKA